MRRSRARRGGHIAVNRAMWQRQSAEYDRRFRGVLGGTHAESWGLWRTPERVLKLLPPVRSRSTLEVGCGAARWSIALAAHGARAVGLDFSSAQLAHARRETADHASTVALVQGSVEGLPFDDDRFDLVFCDWGALTFSDPFRAVPECARVLRPGGALVFATASPLQLVARDVHRDRLGHRLLRPYFGLHRIDFPDEVNFQLPYGTWIALFRRHGLVIDRLVETMPRARARSRYLSVAEERWARRWPMECIWRLTKPAGAGRARTGGAGVAPAATPRAGRRASAPARAPSRR